MKAAAIILTQHTINSVCQTLTPKGGADFAWACLTKEHRGDMYYVTVNHDSPGIEDFRKQVLTEIELLAYFDIEESEVKFRTFWFPVTLKEKT